MYKTILIPVDLGHTEAVSKMIDVARKLGDSNARIALCNVLDMLDDGRRKCTTSLNLVSVGLGVPERRITFQREFAVDDDRPRRVG